jgi:hypothetical protein
MSVMNKCCVSFDVETEYQNIIFISFGLQSSTYLYQKDVWTMPGNLIA